MKTYFILFFIGTLTLSFMSINSDESTSRFVQHVKNVRAAHLQQAFADSSLHTTTSHIEVNTPTVHAHINTLDAALPNSCPNAKKTLSLSLVLYSETLIDAELNRYLTRRITRECPALSR
jgi:hypothetical protein